MCFKDNECHVLATSSSQFSVTDEPYWNFFFFNGCQIAVTHLHLVVRLPRFQLNPGDEKLRLIPVPIIDTLYLLMIHTYREIMYTPRRSLSSSNDFSGKLGLYVDTCGKDAAHLYMSQCNKWLFMEEMVTSVCSQLALSSLIFLQLSTDSQSMTFDIFPVDVVTGFSSRKLMLSVSFSLSSTRSCHFPTTGFLQGSRFVANFRVYNRDLKGPVQGIYWDLSAEIVCSIQNYGFKSVQSPATMYNCVFICLKLILHIG